MKGFLHRMRHASLVLAAGEQEQESMRCGHLM
jgi:hypothetical protein